MPLWVMNLFIMVMTKLTSWLLARGLESLHSKQETDKENADIDARLKAFKDAYKDAFNGEPVTPEQRQRLKDAITTFIRGNPNGGL